MTTDDERQLTLDDLARCYEGAVPAVMCTADADGVPNITYLSRVHQVDAERIAVSNQFMSKTSRNIAINPVGDLLLVDPLSYEEFRLTVRYERTERRGPVFERLRDDVDELAEEMGLQGIFRLRAADIFRVGREHPDHVPEQVPARSLEALVELAAGLERVTDLDTLVEVAIRGLDDVLGYRHVLMLLVDETGSALYAIASRGFDQQNIGAEVTLGDGPIGGPLARCELQRSTGLRQLGKYSRTVRASFEAYGVRPGVEVPVPTLSDVNSRIVVPMRALGQLVGGIVVEDRALAAFDDTDEQVLTIAAAMLGNAIEQARMLAVTEPEGTTADRTAGAGADGEALRAKAAGCAVRCFELDGSVFLDGEYLIKGVAGRILRALVAEHLASGRTAFTNRELRLDRTLDLPGFRDNLESRLLLLQRRLDEREAPLRIVKTGRGKFALDVRAVLTLETVAANSP